MNWDVVSIIPIEQRIREGRISSLDKFMHDLVIKAKQVGDAEPIWDLSAGLATDRVVQSFWDWFKQKVGFAATLASDVETFRPRSIRRSD